MTSRGTWLALLALAGCRPGDFDELRDDPIGRYDAGSTAVDAASGDGSLDAGSDAGMRAPPRDASELPPASDAALACSGSDLSADPKHCGRCGLDCAAPHAESSCVTSQCRRTCEAGYGDCNGDLGLGRDGDGCETRVEDSLSHCGECGIRCGATDGVPACKVRSCVETVSILTSLPVGRSYGSQTGGGPYPISQRCPPGDVLIGLAGKVGQTIYGFGVLCGRMSLGRVGSGYAVSVRPTTEGAQIGNNVTGMPASYRLECPADTVVSAVSGSTEYWQGTATEPNVKSLKLTCAAVVVAADARVSLEANATPLSVGVPNPLQGFSFDERCGAAGLVEGFSGRSGAYIDSIAVHCATLRIEDRPGTAVR